MFSKKKKRSGAVFFCFCALAVTEPENTTSVLRLKSRPESRGANHFKEEFFNLYKILRLRCTPQHQDEDAPGFAPIGRQNTRRLRRTGLLRLCEETMKEWLRERCLRHDDGWRTSRFASGSTIATLSSMV